MDQAEFNRLASMTRMSERAKLSAQAVLVGGRHPVEVAVEHGVTHQCINNRVRAIRGADTKVINGKRYRLVLCGWED